MAAKSIMHRPVYFLSSDSLWVSLVIPYAKYAQVLCVKLIVAVRPHPRRSLRRGAAGEPRGQRLVEVHRDGGPSIAIDSRR